MAALIVPSALTNPTAGSKTAQQGHGSNEEPLKSGNEGAKQKRRDVGQNMVLEKTREFFQVCDIEKKGFITQRDMQRLLGEVPLNADDLEKVFDTLDSDSNGFLTLDEFSAGFSEFLYGRDILLKEGMGDKPPRAKLTEALYQSRWEEGSAASEDEEEKHFSMLMERLGANKVFEDPVEVRSLWAQLRRDEPHLLSNFEDFLARVTSQIIVANQEKREMESALQRKAATHDDEIHRLYEEMEQQIKSERERIVLQDYKTFVSRSQDLERQLTTKEKELEQLFHKQRRLEDQCQELHSVQHVTKVENVKLKKTNDELAKELDQASQELLLAQEQLSLLHQKSTRLNEEKEMEIYRMTEGLQRERASLLKQLDMMREVNKHLRDEKDIFFQNPHNSDNTRLQPRPLCNAGTDTHLSKSCEDVEEDVRQNSANMLKNPCGLEVTRGYLPRIISIEEDHLPHLLQNGGHGQIPLQPYNEGEEVKNQEENIDLVMSDIYPAQLYLSNGESNGVGEVFQTPMFPRGQPVGKENSINEESSPSLPDRLFKIVLVGNSNVGKTSLLRRFCDNSFQPDTSATVGIDYSVKTIIVDNSQVALQVWDTAGQERYRSITKQFFRKADGVVVMYDITVQQSFTAVREWLTSVKEGSGEDIILMLLGNKTDLQKERQVHKTIGERLAKDCQMTFFECSACSGHNVLEAMLHLARTLKEQEDREKEKTVQLVSSSMEKKKSCCQQI
ncbi:EF-hand calcium-binding domain-containing protein 4B [Corythoichthys intestinalis]|uniref:EF-hand calcium-binding domain-containing protein 4B n=1 Tax=Corythoichthys intestinalis TaxID=161448 RepID=UPI0025A5E4B4|nr:EF-hand calcium-binding domain-containing protein 4B [Corythoichthys intestinalis]XP_057693264.1 EF-hand calcium-binding domain-containing protein 4B [Corythoichthys intestinalis]XP_061812945.1 EF-hand calcium-binding domain-containing protein 4B-like [Nerophis lumbriciformis]